MNTTKTQRSSVESYLIVLKGNRALCLQREIILFFKANQVVFFHQSAITLKPVISLIKYEHGHFLIKNKILRLKDQHAIKLLINGDFC